MSENNIKNYTAEEWEHFRSRFSSSILAETEISKLGQTVNISWPFKGSDETPEKYIEYDYEELKSVPGLVNKEKRIHLLMDIFRETLAFDDPFSDMVETVQDEGKTDETFIRILEKHGIPADYPAALVHLSDQTRALVDAEGIQTLEALIEFGQKRAGNALIGGDLKSFLNTLSHRDEKGIARHLPTRRGEKGLYLVQALGLVAEDMSPEAELEILHQTGMALTPEEEETRSRLDAAGFDRELRRGAGEVEKVCDWFASEAADLKHTLETGEDVDRFFLSLSDPRKERVVIALCRAYFGLEEEEERSGFMGRLSGFFKR